MSDLISRQDAIETALTYIVEYCGAAFNEDMQMALKERLDSLPPAQPDWQWIPCRERLPENKKETYWVCTNTGIQCECRWTNVNQFDTYFTMDWHWHFFDSPPYSKIIAWMPLPETYQEDEQDG